jgi:hypothetical protein
MPNLFVVGAESNLEALADSVLRKRTAVATRASALEAIRAANPGLDLDRIDPGTVVVLPPAKGVRPVAAGEPVHDTAVDLVARVKVGIDALLAASERAEEQRRLERQDAEGLFGDPLVKKLSSKAPLLAANLKAVRKSFEAEDAVAEEALESLRQSTDDWAADLEALGTLHG